MVIRTDLIKQTQPNREYSISVSLATTTATITIIDENEGTCSSLSDNLQTPFSSIFQHPSTEATTSLVWTTVAVILAVVAMLIATTSIALGIIVCHKRKCVKPGPRSELTINQG